MIRETSTPSVHRRSGPGTRHVRLAPIVIGLLLLGACAGTEGGEARSAATVPPADPVAAFAATAQPGAESRILLADGQLAAVRLTRVYHAASGRECREVLVGTGATQRSQLVCRGETGWVPARPLLRGGGVGR